MFKWVIGNRKFFMVALFLMVAVYLLLDKRVPAQDWLDNVSEVMVAFLGANIGEHLMEVGKKWIETKNQKDIQEVLKEMKD